MKSKAWVLPILVVLAGVASLLVIAPLTAAVAGSVSLDKAFVKSVGGTLTITLDDADLDVGITQTETEDADGNAYVITGPPNTDFDHFVQKVPILDQNGDGIVNRFDITVGGVASTSVTVRLVFAADGLVVFRHDGTMASGTPFDVTYVAPGINTADVLVASTQDTGGFTLTLIETGAVTGIFTGTFGTATSTTPTTTTPTIATVSGGLVTVRYSDADPAGTRVAIAQVEDIPPTIGDMSPADGSASRTQVQKLVAFVTDSDSGVDAGSITFHLVSAVNGLGVDILQTGVITLSTITTSAITGGFKAEVDVNGIPAGETTITWTVTASDVAGNTDTSDVQTFKVDTVAPVLASPMGAITGQFWDAEAAAIVVDPELASNNSIRLIFNEALDGNLDENDFEVGGVTPVAAEWFAAAPESVFLTVAPMPSDAEPVIEIVGDLADAAGNVRSAGGTVSAKDGIAPGNVVVVTPELSVSTVEIDVSSDELLLGSPSIKVNGVGLQTVKIGDMTWRATFTIGVAGKYDVETTTTDPDGNARSATASFEIDNALPAPPAANLKPTGDAFRPDPIIEIGWTTEADEYGAPGDDTHPDVTLIEATLDGQDVLTEFSSTDNQTHAMTASGLALGEHTVVVKGQDDAGNENEIMFTFTAVESSLACDGVPANIIGTAGDDTLVGTVGNDVIVGLEGEDTIIGMGGNDIICGGPGDDTLVGGPGNDRIFGGPGDDAIMGGRGRDRLLGNRGHDVIVVGRGWDRLLGGFGNDIIAGRRGRDTIRCGPGIDFADGGPHIDTALACEATVNVP